VTFIFVLANLLVSEIVRNQTYPFTPFITLVIVAALNNHHRHSCIGQEHIHPVTARTTDPSTDFFVDSVLQIPFVGLPTYLNIFWLCTKGPTRNL
jgi:hypothetical protein